MSLSAMSPFKRLLGGVAVAALAVTLAACSDEKKETAAAPENQATTEIYTRSIVGSVRCV